jgi:hypothetical protein
MVGVKDQMMTDDEMMETATNDTIAWISRRF